MQRTRLLLSVITSTQLALLGSANATIIPGTSGTINGSTVSSYADVTGSHLNAVGYQVSGEAFRNPGAAPAELFLTLPSQASDAGFLELGFEWNPMGHEPPGIYDLPHFDMHFYYISDSFRMTIPGGVVTAVNPQSLPANYSQPGPTVPMMGGHAVDLLSPEFNGGTFTKTFIYGYYLGKETFIEPMATQAYLLGLPDGVSTFSIRQPSVYGQSVVPMLVPTTVNYAYNSDTDLYTISLGDFITTPVPEPGTLAFLGAGVLACFGVRRNRRRA